MKKTILTLALLSSSMLAEMSIGKNYTCTGTNNGKPLTLYVEPITRQAMLINDFYFEFNPRSKIFVGDIDGYKVYMGLASKLYKMKFYNLPYKDVTCKEI